MRIAVVGLGRMGRCYAQAIARLCQTVHDFDLARWLMSSDVERVSAEGALLACEQLSTVSDIDKAVINLRFASGAVGNVEVSRNARYGYDIRTEVLDAYVPHFVRRFAVAYRAQIEHFVECWHEHRAPSVGGADALAAFEIARAATEAWQTGWSIGVALLHVN
jgi:scyllo-inositol 2-dehydrogenase (NAD+)